MVESEKSGGNSQAIIRQSLEAAIESLGGPIHKTINWYMNSKGVFSDPKKIDINVFYSNLKELVGPGADLIMEETCEYMQRHYGAKTGRDSTKFSPLERIQKMMEIGE